MVKAELEDAPLGVAGGHLPRDPITHSLFFLGVLVQCSMWPVLERYITSFMTKSWASSSSSAEALVFGIEVSRWTKVVPRQHPSLPILTSLLASSLRLSCLQGVASGRTALCLIKFNFLGIASHYHRLQDAREQGGIPQEPE